MKKSIADNLLEEMAASGDATARCELGSRFSKDVGIGQERDDAQATQWYKAEPAGLAEETPPLRSKQVMPSAVIPSPPGVHPQASAE